MSTVLNSVNSVNSYSAVLPPSPMVFFSLAQLVNLLDIHLTAFGVQVLPIMSTGTSGIATTHLAVSYLDINYSSIFRKADLPDVLLFDGCALGPGYPWSSFRVEATSHSNPGLNVLCMSNVEDNFEMAYLLSMVSKICKISPTYVAVSTALAQSGKDNFR